MAREGKSFELAYKWIYNLDKDKYKVTSPAYLYDPFSERKREIDVLVEFYDKDNINRKLAIECRDRNKIQDVTWIEQLQQKKEDLSLDYILATTTTNFTRTAITKAKKHGVIIERAETFNSQSITNISQNEFFFDVFFVKLTFEELNFFVKNVGIIKFKDFIKQLNFAEQMELQNELNTGYYYSIEPHEFLKKAKVTEDDFFQNTKDNSIIINSDIHFENDIPPIFLNKNILFFTNKIKITPFRLSLPLNKSLSVFEVEEKKNKKYCAIFGNEDDFVELGYIEDDNYSNIQIKKRKYLKIFGGNIHLNTIFPNKGENFKINWSEIAENLSGEFDFSKII